MESKDTRYNGWKNYETWAVISWLENDHLTYDIYNEWLEYEYKDNQDHTRTLADTIKEWIQQNNPLNNASLYTDLLNAALSEVDYYEIAEFLLNET